MITMEIYIFSRIALSCIRSFLKKKFQITGKEKLEDMYLNDVDDSESTHNPRRSTTSLTLVLTRSFLDVRESVPDFSYSASTLGLCS